MICVAELEFEPGSPQRCSTSIILHYHEGSDKVIWRGVIGRNGFIDLNPSGALMLEFRPNKPHVQAQGCVSEQVASGHQRTKVNNRL